MFYNSRNDNENRNSTEMKLKSSLSNRARNAGSRNSIIFASEVLKMDTTEDNEYDTINLEVSQFTSEDDLGYVEPICTSNHIHESDSTSRSCSLQTLLENTESKQSKMSISSGPYEKIFSQDTRQDTSNQTNYNEKYDDSPLAPAPPLPLSENDSEYEVLLTDKLYDPDENVYDDPEIDSKIIVIQKKAQELSNGPSVTFKSSNSEQPFFINKKSAEEGTFMSDVPPPLPPRNLRLKKRKWLGKLKSAKSEPKIPSRSLVKKDSKEKDKEREKFKSRSKRWSFLSANDEEVPISKSKFYYHTSSINDLESDATLLSKSMFNLNLLNFDDGQSSGYSSCRENISTDSSFYKESCTSGDDSSIYMDHNTLHNKFIGSKSILEENRPKIIKPVQRSVSFPKNEDLDLDV